MLSCKNNSTDTAVNSVDYIGWVMAIDSLYQPLQSSANIKVTLIQTGQTVLTDSLGHYSFNNITSGIYDFKYEFANYPDYYLQDVKIESSTGSVVVADKVTEISPKPITMYRIDSLKIGKFSIGEMTFDSALSISISGESPVPLRKFVYLQLISKTKDGLGFDLIQKPILSVYTRLYDSTYSTSKINSTGIYYYHDLYALGFKKGDSIYFQYYPLCSKANYIEKKSNKIIYPYIGLASNVVSTVMK